MTLPDCSTPDAANVPSPQPERGVWLLAIALGALGVVVLVAVLAGVVGRTTSAVPAAAPPPVLVTTATPAPSASRSAISADASVGVRQTRAAIVTQPSSVQQSIEARHLVDRAQARISQRWMEGFYPIYAVAQSTFGVNWLLIASIHRQESAFSTAPSTYRGLNFAGCCGGPMQFNVTNRPVSTWQLVSDSYVYARRPSAYDHMTTAHPSIYDDFDSIMAAAHLLSADGGEYALDGAAWDAAYAYYGHDVTGVSYADEVLARAIGWSQHGFCMNCGVEGAMIEAVHAAYGAPVLATLRTATAATAARVHK
jgi:hypothetical protein